MITAAVKTKAATGTATVTEAVITATAITAEVKTTAAVIATVITAAIITARLRAKATSSTKVCEIYKPVGEPCCLLRQPYS